MEEQAPRAFFDFTDPLSYLTTLEIARLPASVRASIEWTPFELRPPPTPLLAVNDPSLTRRWSEAATLAAERAIELSPPNLLPWSRKALELYLHALDNGLGDAIRRATFSAFFAEGSDIGRVDVLVEVGRAAGLDPTEAKAVLDVDRYEEELLRCRALGVSLGVADVPTLISGAGRLEGFHNRTALGTFLT